MQTTHSLVNIARAVYRPFGSQTTTRISSCLGSSFQKYRIVNFCVII